MNMTELSCIDCAQGGCFDGSGGYPAFCPTAALADADRDALARAYRDGDDAAIMSAASAASTRATAEMLCRVEETMEFAARLGVRRVGIAACAGLMHEARVLARIMRANGFEPVGIACKVGALPKSELGLDESCCDYGAISCDPLLQARLLNEAGVGLNVIVGLCVGHDALFIKHADAPCTVLIAKDRPLGHNPVAALRAAETSWPYNRMLKPRAWGEPRSRSCSCGTEPDDAAANS